MTTQKKSPADKNEYEGKKDEYGGTMTGTGYGRQAGEKKEAEKEIREKVEKQKSEEMDDNGYEDSAGTKGFNEGQGQGSGIDNKHGKKGN